jgi:pimeloyl-ACP methyl ester carboxylesterase
MEGAGEGPDVLVLLHGFPFTPAMWRPQLEADVPGWRSIAPDLRGFGGNGPLPALPARRALTGGQPTTSASLRPAQLLMRSS